MKTASDANAWLRHIDHNGHITQVRTSFLAPSEAIFNFKFNFNVGNLKKCLLNHHPEIAPSGLPDHPGGPGGLIMA